MILILKKLFKIAVYITFKNVNLIGTINTIILLLSIQNIKTKFNILDLAT